MKLEIGNGIVIGGYLGAGGEWGLSKAFQPSHKQIFPILIACWVIFKGLVITSVRQRGGELLILGLAV